MRARGAGAVVLLIAMGALACERDLASAPRPAAPPPPPKPEITWSGSGRFMDYRIRETIEMRGQYFDVVEARFDPDSQWTTTLTPRPTRSDTSAARPLAIPAGAAVRATQQATRLHADSGRFLLDGKPLQIISGEMHYARVPREYWRDRLRKARAMGLNTVSTYVFWNYHEVEPGKFDFTGQRDVAEFIRVAATESLHVIVRPGPYVCAEWELGGFPGWLFADSSIVLRSTDPKFTRPAERWIERLARELAPLMGARGPIIAVQVENEYGSFDKDAVYMAWQRDLLARTAFNRALLYTADGDIQLRDGSLPDVPAVVNFGIGGSDSAFARLARFRPKGPLMSGEWWAGWFDQWGVSHHTTNTQRQVRELASMLTHGYSVNIYMFHGGTTPGFMNGANIDNGRFYHPQTSSYDYDSALDESGRPTPKYLAFRNAIAEATHATPVPLVPIDSTVAIPSFPLQRSASLWSALGKPAYVARPRNMEAYGQSTGYILYRTTVTAPASGLLTLRDVRDYGRVFVDGKEVGVVDRRLFLDTVRVTLAAGSRLDILVENLGRVNYGKPLRDERKGLIHPVLLDGAELMGWDVFTLPMSTTPAPRWQATRVDGPAFYQGTFDLDQIGDSFLDTRGWGKGTVWVNGHHLGRFWSIGPQQTLYVPGAWLRRAGNEVVVFTYASPVSASLAGVRAPIFGANLLRPQ